MKQVWQVLVIGAMVAASFPGTSTAQWVEVSRPDGWRIKDLVVEGPYLFAATKRGVYRSEDDGETWSAASSGLGNSNVTSIVASGASLVVGTGEGAYRSTDLGTSWTAANEGLPRPMPMDVCWPAVSVGGEIFIGTDVGVFKSEDRGEVWTTVNFGLPGDRYIDGLAVIDSIVFAATSGGVFRTVNLGLDWTRVDMGISSSSGFEAIAQLGDVLFVGTGRGIYVSTDRGVSWTQIELNVPTGGLWSLSAGVDRVCAEFDLVLLVITKQGGRWVAERSSDSEFQCADSGTGTDDPLVDAYRTGFDQSIDRAASGTPVDRRMIEDSLEDLYEVGGHLYADTGDGLFRSVDGGETWQALDADLPRTLSVNAFFVSETGVFAGTGRGVFVSRNHGRSWEPASPGEIEVFDFAAKGASLYAGTDDGLYVTHDDGKTWSTTGLVLGRFTDVTSVVVLGAALVADTRDGTFISRDDGATWVEIESDQLGNYDWDEVAVVGQDLFLGGYHGLMRSSDLGSTWIDLSPGLPEAGHVDSLTALGDRLFLISADETVLRSEDRGSTWQGTSPLPSFGLSGMLAAVGDSLVANTSEGIFVSADGGASWTALDSDPFWQEAYAFAKDGSNLIAGTREAGIFIHKPGSGTWKPSSDGLPRDSNWPGEGIVWAGKYMFVGTADGVYRSADFGATWSGDTSMKEDGPLVFSLVTVDNSVLLGTVSSIFQSSDNGETWTPMRPDLETWEGFENLRVVGSTLMTDLLKSGTFFLARDGGDWQSVDDQAGNDEPPEFDNMTTLSVFGATIFARKDNQPGLFMSEDAGASWSRTDEGIPETAEVTSISVYWKDLHARTQDGQFISTDGGRSWISIGSGPPEGTMIWDYSIGDTHVFARNVDGEVWRRPRIDPAQSGR